MTAVPIHTVVTTPGPSPSPSHADPTPQNPGSPQATPNNQSQPQQDSLDDIRSDLDHQPGGLSQPDPADQQALADAVPHNEDGTPQRFPDPFGPYTQLQNDGGNTVPGRSNNCADCSRSFLETWYGNPQVSAPRTVDLDENGKHNPFTPEDNANANQIRWTGAAHSYAGPGGDPNTANNIASTLQHAGPGSAAIVQVDWPGGGGHAFNVVNHNGKIVWIDTQSGQVSEQPLHIDQAKHVWHIPLDADRNPIDTSKSDDKDSEGTEGSKDSENQNDESQNQNDDASQPENSEKDGQPENTHNPQDDASDDTEAQGDGTDTTTESPEPAVQPSPDASDNADSAKPSTTDLNSSEPDGTPDGHEPSPATPDTPDQQSRPDEGTRADSPTDNRQSPTDTTSDDGTSDDSTRPARTATDDPNDPTTDRDTPQQNTTPSDPRTPTPDQENGDPRATDPRTADPRTMDPRTPDPRVSDPRTSDPHRDTPTQKRPEADERPDSRRPDETHTDHADDPRSQTPHKDPSETPEQTRPEHADQPPTDDHRDRPSDMNKDSAVPTRESLPDGKNADAASYVKDSTRGKDPLYGPIAGETNTSNTRPSSDGTSPPLGPAEPAARNDEDGQAFIRRMVDFANESRANRKLYWRKDGQRKHLDDRVDDRELPQLKRDPDHPDDEDKFIAASDVPPPVQPDYMPEETHPPVSLGRDEGRITTEDLADLDALTNDREWTLQADRLSEGAKLQAKEDHGEDSEEYRVAKRVYAETHSSVRDIGEQHGEQAALLHAMATQHPEYILVDVPRTGNGSDQFDQIYEDPNNPGHYIVVEAKAPTGQLGPRTGHTGQKVMQGTREYFETIYMLMQEGTPEQKAIADKLEAAYELGNVQYILVQSKVVTDPEANEAAGNGDTDGGYVGDEGPRERKRYGGANMEYFDIRKPEDRQE